MRKLSIVNYQLAMHYQLPISDEQVQAKPVPSLQIANCKLLIEATERSV
jgi:N6-adenosine-specific RNA methylase IME4